MNLEDLLSNDQLLGQLAKSAGVASGDARTGLAALLPAVTRGLERNAGSSDGLGGLIGALSSGAHERYVDSPDLLGSTETRTDGNAILGHIFGNKDVSRNVAASASAETGLDSSLLRKMLPLVASLAMGALSKGTERGAGLEGSSSAGGDVLGSILGGLLGGSQGQAANDSPLDDILDLAKKFL